MTDSSTKYLLARQASPSAPNDLTQHDESKAVPQDTFIFRLPDEFLTTVLDIAAQKNHWGQTEPWYSINSIKNQLLTCRRFNRIALQFFYREISCEVPTAFRSGTTRSLDQLRSNLQRDPTLGLYCREFSVRVNVSVIAQLNVEGGWPSIINDLLPFLARVHTLRISGAFLSTVAKDTWEFLRGIKQHMPQLRCLILIRQYSPIQMGDILEHIDIPSLRELRAHGIYADPGKTFVLDPKKQRISPVTSLTLGDYEEGPEATRALLQWPKALSHLRFMSFYNNSFAMDLPMFHSWLLVHRETLKTIDIGYLSHEGNGRMFNASDFPNLESLTLSRWQLAYGRWNKDKPFKFSAAVADSLLAPNLRTFGLDFTIYDQHSEGFEDFGEEEEAWIRELANAAIARKAALRCIKITFTPEPWRAKNESSFGYPWDRMDKIHEEIRSHGLSLVYNKPTLTRREWNEEIGLPNDEDVADEVVLAMREEELGNTSAQ